MMQRVTLAITGASGAQYALRLLECLLHAQCQVYLLVSEAARVVIETETDQVFAQGPDELKQQLLNKYGCDSQQLQVLGPKDWMSAVASGSGCPESMVICPCSGGTLSAVATGACNNLIERAADVILKERKQLIIMPRETPVSTLHLQNMLTLSQMGALILPASPGFYYQPKAIDDLVDFVVARILDHLNIPHQLTKRWGKEIDAMEC